MYSMRQLEKAIDSLEKEIRFFKEQIQKDIFRQVQFAGIIDTGWVLQKIPVKAVAKQISSFDELLPDSAKAGVNQRVQELAGSIRISTESLASTMKEKERNLRKHKIEWHRKIVLSLACLVLFLIGAPLGAIIRKGGLGTPIIFAIIFFMVFYFSSTTGEKFAKENTLSPFVGMWMATFILVPVGLFLTYKAMRDSHLFNKEFYYRSARLVGAWFGKRSKR
jgi:lipopolysaccharide export system permease protein